MPYNEMTDRELIIRLYAKVDNLADDMNEIKQSLKDRPCPSNMCHDHDGRITTVESYIKVLGGAVVVLTTAIVSFVIDKLWGG